jgi:hypothetical protein
VYLDDETLHRMIESFGPLEYSQVSIKIQSKKTRYIWHFKFAATLNQHEAYSTLAEQDPFGTMGWQPDMQLASLTKKNFDSEYNDVVKIGI